jgi:hypothetical protein
LRQNFKIHMKKTFQFLLLFLSLSFVTKAQLSTYSFSHGSESFQSIESNPDRNIILYGGYHGYSSYFIPKFPLGVIKGFGFPITGVQYTYYTGLACDIRNNNNITDIFGLIPSRLTFKANDEDGWVAWDTTVNQSNHDTLFVLEYHNVVFDSVKSSTGISKFTFQVHFHTIDNSVEFRYGPAMIAPGAILSDLIIVGLVYAHQGSTTGPDPNYTLILKGNPANPVLTNEFIGLNNWPAANTVYRFTPAALPPNPTKINEESLQAEKIKIYPVPANNTVQVNFNGLAPESATIIDAGGRHIRNIEVKNKSVVNINTNDIENGIYYLKIQLADETLSKKFIVSH